MKLRRILTGAAISGAIAIAIRSFAIWELPWDWDWANTGVVVRLLIAWAACAGGMVSEIFTRSIRGRQ
ncbi:MULTISPECIES: hypothetical protein [unclassified Novosphingobium]|uniref:hypothetical protein n=1 Tax=unclassified Novosphingobium TaxID=2644732 RepID=UPI000D30AC33|nr:MULTISPECIES: hypothetical protein [unclassified Novosphingobium]PTR05069.1 hypothetical protein C8K11_1478 [Novosphingobium sp. GV055]PUA93658.1 hypothetical protein C8K12_1487 [Novosphingobium sp. GV061]PUB10435.1 hypothetical protein C8K14_1448 [Novosphingobium sp. GV079]PUB35962.1 hypothetical protein C8K10_1554 [Novosphingobium sp. GV027]